jgi:histidinol-phosphate/aromatic aminotransferase/cobyric acid decarboxylase-like protein
MNDQIKPQPGILDIALYEGGKAHVAGVANVVKLSSNENPFGPSDKAKEAFARTVHSLHRYPNTDHADLRAAIAEVHGWTPPHHLRRRVGRDHHLPLPGLCRARATRWCSPSTGS